MTDEKSGSIYQTPYRGILLRPNRAIYLDGEGGLARAMILHCLGIVPVGHILDIDIDRYLYRIYRPRHA